MPDESPNDSVQASFEQDVEPDAEVAPSDKLDQLEKAAFFQGHETVLGNERETSKKQHEQIIRKICRGSAKNTHKDEGPPYRPVDGPAEKAI
jgi:hypothetical protein